MPSIELEPMVAFSQSPVAIVDPLRESAWDQVISTFPDASFFHSTAWARVLNESYGHRPVYFRNGSPAAPAAILPLMEVNSALMGRRGVSLPFTDECKPLASDQTDIRTVFARAIEHAESNSWRHLEIRGGSEAFPEAPPSTVFWGHHLALNRPEKELFLAIEPSCRRSIRKAERGGLVIEVSQSMEATQTFHRLLELTRRKHGVPPQPVSFFRSLQRHVLATNRGCIVLARLGSTPIAGALFLHFGTTTLFKYGASDPQYQQLRGNNLVMWHAIHGHARKGFKKMDLGRTSLGNEGLREFKLSWGSQERMINYIKYDCRTRAWVTSPDRSSGWYTSVFKHLPLPLSRLVGRILYRHVS